MRFEAVEKDRVRVTGAGGTRRPDQLKASIGYHGGFIGEGSIGYAGPGAVARAELAAETVKARLSIIGSDYSDIRFDLLGINSLHREATPVSTPEPYEVRLRVTARTETLKDARAIGNEVETLYTNGPAGGGGAVKGTREIIAVSSALIPRDTIVHQLILEEVR